ncbi:MAG: YncE family protein [Polyangiaceae bacterium]|nr:YncE family protein [Polyangiaceae bacterium]
MRRSRLQTNPSPARAAIALAFVIAGCSGPEPSTTYTYDPYEGDAYPNLRPKIAIPPGGIGIVSDSLSDTLSVLDLTTGERLGSYPAGREPVTIDGPHHVAADAARGAVYIGLSYPVDAASLGPHAAHGASLLPGYVQKLALDDMRILGQVRVDPNPGDIVLSQDGKRLVVSHFDLQRAVENPVNLDAARATLAVLDPEAILPTGSPSPKRVPICIAPHGVALSRPDGARAFVACYGEDVLAIADLTNPGAEIKRIPVGGDASLYNPVYGPYTAVMSADGAWIAVSNTVSSDVRLFDVAGEVFDPARTIKTVGVPFFAAFSADGSRLFIPTQKPDAIVVIDIMQGTTEILSRLFAEGECERPHLVEVHDATTLFVVCEGDWKSPGRVLKLNPESLETVASAEVGVYPDGLVRVLPNP